MFPITVSLVLGVDVAVQCIYVDFFCIYLRSECMCTRVCGCVSLCASLILLTRAYVPVSMCVCV